MFFFNVTARAFVFDRFPEMNNMTLVKQEDECHPAEKSFSGRAVVITLEVIILAPSFPAHES